MRGELDFRQDADNHLLLAKWHDNAVVSVISNWHAVQPLHSAACRSAKERKECHCPWPNRLL